MSDDLSHSIGQLIRKRVFWTVYFALGSEVLLRVALDSSKNLVQIRIGKEVSQGCFNSFLDDDALLAFAPLTLVHPEVRPRYFETLFGHEGFSITVVSRRFYRRTFAHDC